MRIPYAGEIQTSRAKFTVISCLIANSISWYYLMSDYLQVLLAGPHPTLGHPGHDLISASFFIAIPLASLSAASALSRLNTGTILRWWIILDIAVLFFPSLFELRRENDLLIFAVCLGASVGLGFPASLEYFSNSTFMEERGRVGGSIVFLTYLLSPLLVMATQELDPSTRVIAYAAWRGLGLATIPFIHTRESGDSSENEPAHIPRNIQRRRFLLYFAPWVIFSLTNGIDTHIFSRFQPPETVEKGLQLMYVSGSFSSLLGGIAIDFVGRRASIIFAMTIYGIGYAALSFAQNSIVAWLLFTITIGIAWGLLTVAYVLVLWGELGLPQHKERYYAIGMTPFFLSQAAGYLLKPMLSQFSSTHLFSVATLLYFIAVIPLLFAEEVVPPSVRERRRMREYIEKAKQLTGQTRYD